MKALVEANSGTAAVRPGRAALNIADIGAVDAGTVSTILLASALLGAEAAQISGEADGYPRETGSLATVWRTSQRSG